MAKNKKEKIEKEPVSEPITEVTEVAEFTEKEQILKEWQEFYIVRVYKKYRGTVEDGKKIFDIFNRLTGRHLSYSGCGSCTASKITYLNNEYKSVFGEEIVPAV